MRISGTRYFNDGYMENNNTDQWNATGHFVYEFKNHSSIDLYLAWMKTERGGFIQWLNQNMPFEVPPYNKKDKLLYETTNFYVQYHVPFSSLFGLKFRISYLQSEIGNQLTAYDPGAFDPGQGFGWEIQGDWYPHILHHITFGNEFRWDLSGSEYFGDHKGYTISPYIQDEYTVLSNLKATVGLRLDYHELIDETINKRYSPKIGINYQPVPHISIRTTIGSGFRAATVFEKYIKADYAGFNVIPNPDLKAERSWFTDIGLRYAFMKNSYLEFSFFQSEYWDMIEPVINFLGTIQFQNYIRARIHGIEFSIESWFFHRCIGLQANCSLMDPKDLQHNEVLPYRPKWFYNIIGSLCLGPFSLQTEYKYSSRFEHVEINPLDPRVPVKLLSLRTQYDYKIFTFQLSVNNALNYHFNPVERRMGEIRNVSFSLLMDIQ
jgi:outer membrane receptor protein involved in Fe transport